MGAAEAAEAEAMKALGVAWRPLARLTAAALDATDLHAALGGFPAVLALPAGGGWTAPLVQGAKLSLEAADGPADTTGATGAAGRALLKPLEDVRLEVRNATAVARSGGAFHVATTDRADSGSTGDGDRAASSRGCRQDPTLDAWRRGAGAPLVFDTRRGSALHAALRQHLAAAPPAALRRWARTPIASLGRAPVGWRRGEAAETQEAGGLAFHRHERSWLYLAAGRKRWYFHIGGLSGAPATALARVTETELREQELLAAAEELRSGGAGASASLLTHDQVPGECVFVPDGVWHCTYNLPESTCDDSADSHVVVGYGGMGACDSDLEFFSAAGDVVSLRSAWAGKRGGEATRYGGDWTEERAPSLARVAAEQAQLEVLEWLVDTFGRAPLVAADAQGATPLHFAAAAGSASVAEYLLAGGGGVDVGARDVHGTTAAHWAARSGSPSLLAVLRAHGADFEAADDFCRCRPLHLFAAEGHLDAVCWAVEVAGAAPDAADGRGRCALDYARAGQHDEVVAWLAGRPGPRQRVT